VLEAMLDFDRPTDPGTHKVTATATGMLPAETTVTLKDGESGSASLKLEPDPNAAAAAAPAAPAAAPPANPPPASEPMSATSSGSSSKVPALALVGVGVVGIGVGTIFGISALSTKSTLDQACNANKGCPASSQSDIDSLGSKATLSTVGFIVGIVGLAAGGYLFFAASDSPPAATGAAPPKPRVQPFVGLNSAGLVGTF